MENQYYGSVCIEGGDQLGKGDATSEIVRELEKDDVNLTYSSFPVYATPVGAVIRSFLKGGFSNPGLEEKDSLDVRMALFALNRLEFMDVYLGDKKYRDTMLIFDRSPFSNALTIGYWLSLQQGWDEEEVAACIDRAVDYDSLMITELGLDRCVVQLVSTESEWRSVRTEKEVDQHERQDVQEMSRKVYGIYRDVVGPSWHQVVTRRDDGWRAREDIRNDIKSILRNTYGDMENIRQGLRYNIGFEEIVNKIYPQAQYSQELCCMFNSAVRENVKDVMYASGLELGRQVAESCVDIRISNEKVKAEFRRILDIIPNMIAVFEYYYGKSFVEKLEKALK